MEAFERLTTTDETWASADALEYAERTSIVRARRLPVPPAQVRAACWTEGQTLRILSDNGALVVRSGGGGRKIRFLPTGLVGPADKLGFEIGQVLMWERLADGLRVFAVDGLAHESYSHPSSDRLGISIPPSWLAQAFTGKPDSALYLQSGARTAQSIAELSAAAGKRLATLGSILDFGCGAGRVLRFMPSKTNAVLVGYDLHTPSIEWCREHLGFGRWEHGIQKPPLAEQDESYDLIYAISVLTHLDEEHQNLWLSEWKRLLRPGGILIATYRSEHFVQQFIRPKSSDYADAVLKGLNDGYGFTYFANGGWSGIFPEYYNDAYHSSEYVERHWGEVFQILRLYPAGTLADRQDTALLRKADGSYG